MNNNLKTRAFGDNLKSKLLLIPRKMKLFFLFVLMTVGIASAEPLLAQEAKVSLRMDNQRLEDVLKAVEKQTDLVFIYDSNIIDVDHKVSVNTQGENVYELLNSVFAQNEVAYTVINNKVVLSKATKAQQEGTTIKGTILDVTGLPIIGANVTIKGTTIGTITDLDGNFSLQIPQNAILTVSYIGYKPIEVNTQGKKTFNLVLKEDAEALEEVVVIGYGVQKKADLTGAVASVKAENLNVESNTNIVRALQGKMSGVEIVSNGGEPGNSSSVMIRGVGTFNNNAPLYIVDGMYMDGIDFINPNDIESIDVLKDASSAAIYGSRAANGVIIVTTKSGSDTSGVPTITASANLGFQNASKKIDVLNASQWSQITTESRQAAGLDALPLALNPEADNDFQDMMMQTGLMQTYNVSAKGGSSNFKYYVGGGYTNQEGIIEKTGYERLNLQVKTEFKKGILTVGENVLISFERQKPSERVVSRKGGIVGSMLNSIPAYNIYDASQDGGYNGPTGDALTWANPIAIMDMTAKRNEYSKTYVNTYAELELPYNLKYKLNVNTDLKNTYTMDFVPHYSMGLNSNDRNTLTETRGNNKNLLIENLLTFDKTFGDHKLTALAGYTFQYNKYSSMGVNSSNMPDGLYVADAATETLGTGGLIKNSLNSVLARIFYSYKNRYLLTATYRRDGSSKFMEENQHGDFPSVSLGWNIKEENFMQKYDFLDMMKLRAGYGVLGNQEVGNYLYSSTVSSSINYLKNGNEMWNGAFPKTFASPSIKWEETKMTNVGLDFAFFNSKLKATFEYYVKNTSDILLNVPIPISTGASNNPLVNAGEIENRGFEWMFGWDDRGKDWSYSVNLVGSTISNEVKKMGTGDQVIWSGVPNQSGGNTTKSLQGYPIGGFWLIETDGLFQSDAEAEAYTVDGNMIQPNAKAGDIRFIDQNGDGLINDDDRVYKGSPFESLTLGLNANASWKAFDISVGIQGKFGAKIYNAMRADIEDVSKGINYSAEVLNHWTESNTDATSPRLVWNDPNQNARTSSDRFLENGDYVRISNMQFGYNLPKNMLHGLTKARVYLNADNLLTITGYKGFSPDVNGSSVLSRGVDSYTYPLPRTITFGVNVSF